MTDEFLVVAYDPEWPELFAELAGRLRWELGDLALRIDHIGSTAVPGLDAKPIVDVQISVANLEPVDAYRRQIENCGFVWRADNTELKKRYFREQPGRRRTHIHVRRAGSFSEQFALLFRDYLRTHPERGAEYARLKHRLAPLLRTDRHRYVEAQGAVYLGYDAPRRRLGPIGGVGAGRKRRLAQPRLAAWIIGRRVSR